MQWLGFQNIVFPFSFCSTAMTIDDESFGELGRAYVPEGFAKSPNSTAGFYCVSFGLNVTFQYARVSSV